MDQGIDRANIGGLVGSTFYIMMQRTKPCFATCVTGSYTGLSQSCRAGEK